MGTDVNNLFDILGRQNLPIRVVQKQFDQDDAALERIGRALPQDEVSDHDLWCYAMDLKYVRLQPELLRHALPFCLRRWQAALYDNTESGFMEQFPAALAQRERQDIIAGIIGDEGVKALSDFMADSILERMSQESELRPQGKRLKAYKWFYQFNSYGTSWPGMGRILGVWRALKRPGLAVCAVQYLSVLAFGEKDNPIFGEWTRNGGGGPPQLWENASIGFGERWLDANIEVFHSLLSADKLTGWARDAAKVLRDHPDMGIVRQVNEELLRQKERVEKRIPELLTFLSTPSEPKIWEWSDAAK